MVSDDQLKELFSNPLVKESIYLASPILFKEIKKWSQDKNPDTKGKIRNSFLKYLSRISSRPTPFGLFSGCCIGVFDTSNTIRRNNSLNKRHTRLDMNLTGIIVKHIQEIPSVREHLLFYPNNSLYEIGDLVRFIEAKYNKKLILVNKLIEVEASDYLKEVIDFCSDGKKINELSEILVSPEITFEDAKEFITELIDEQILVGEIEQTVSGIENLDHILSVLSQIDDSTPLYKTLSSIKDKLNEMDSNVINSIAIYNEILKLLDSLGITIDEKFVFQTDLKIGTSHNTLSKEIKKDIDEGLIAINKIATLKNQNTNENLSSFKKAFYDRYETKEVPLALVLDKEMGLGYPANSGEGDVNQLIDDIVFGNSSKTSSSTTLSSFDMMLLNKAIEADKTAKKIIEIKEEDLPSIDGNWLDLPDTFSTIAQIVNIEDKYQVLLNFFSGSSAGNLFGRFCHGDNSIKQFVEEIINFEDDLNPDKILAEIVHLPEDRLGNVLMRPSLRTYEIPFLSRSTKENNYQIPVSDILISIRNNRIFLRSKKYNKEVCPKLTTAHSFNQSTLPAYRFLCDMQSLDKRNILVFNWDGLSNVRTFFPRIIYKNIVLSSAKWKITSDKMKSLLEEEDDDLLLQKTKTFIDDHELPDMVYLAEGDNKLLINLSNLSSIKMLLSLVKTKNAFLLEEFLFSGNAICKDDENKNYVNEFVFSFYKDVIQ
ncbi:lantibiotic dehydratase family protein [uncultured Dokdonia sp.]|uniref:lantibiotic dehydratase family protein n=1 Tax=uncultured Dokdonia sp. TaxID=575653 RepID=UPI002622924B|nr:lantibiotic dehydratase family protein [uncultured Dokdonia sp.]